MTAAILVTGASKGIGKAVAERLARDGYDVVVHYGRDRAGAEATLERVRAAGRDGRLLQFDIADRAECRSALEADIARHGMYYGVVLNAGITRDGVFPGLADDDWDDVIDTNLDGFYNVLKPLILPLIRTRRPGRIVAVSSVSGLAGNPGQVNYSAAKAGIIGAAKALAVELASRNITVNCVAPGLIDTDMVTASGLTGERLDAALKLVPMGRIGKPEEVAAVVAFLCSDAASYVTRQVIGVNGGML
jgi:3-oxoacyl-[acyl-carrier protein] reductase